MADYNAPDSTWILVPARGGSKGIPRKNLRSLKGRPLLVWVLGMLRSYFPQDQVIVSTEDPEIQDVARPLATIHERASSLAGDVITLDEVAVEVGKWLSERGASPSDLLLTIQATSPFLSIESVQGVMKQLEERGGSVITVRDDRHLRWTLNEVGQPIPLYEERVNRQDLPVSFVETGGIIGTQLGHILETQTRIAEPISLYELNDREGLDIDTYADWVTAEYYAERQRIVIRADSRAAIGMGHVYRAAAIAYELSAHDLIFVTRGDGPNELGAQHLAQYPFPLQIVSSEQEFFRCLSELQPEITILDVLDTSLDFVEEVREHTSFVVSLEDLGPGAEVADIVINDLYTDLHPRKNHWYGVEHAILAPVFESVTPKDATPSSVETILITFGGSDPANLTYKALEALELLEFQGETHVVVGPGFCGEIPILEDYGLTGTVRKNVLNMAVLMRSMDLAVTSGGRTVTELMTVGVPTLVCCQNTKELRHTHASGPYGVINLGLGEHLAPDSIAEHLKILLGDGSLREDMRRRALAAVKQRSNANVVQRILESAQNTLAGNRQL